MPRVPFTTFHIAMVMSAALAERQNKYYTDSMNMISSELSTYTEQQAAATEHEALSATVHSGSASRL
jgi:hypothetical protein